VVRQAGGDDTGDAGHKRHHGTAAQKGKDGRVTVLRIKTGRIVTVFAVFAVFARHASS
jgi:hypothetical protein